MMTKTEMLMMKKAEAMLKAEQNARKSQNVIKAGANLPSQWGKVVTNEQRLIDNGHYMKSAERAKLDFYREEVRKAKKKEKIKIVLVKKV